MPDALRWHAGASAAAVLGGPFKATHGVAARAALRRKACAAATLCCCILGGAMSDAQCAGAPVGLAWAPQLQPARRVWIP